MALVKYNNRSILNVTALDSIASGGLNLLATNTISSGVSSSSFTSSIDSTYDTYMFKFINMHPASSNTHFRVNFRDGWSSYDATKTSTSFVSYHREDDSQTTLTYRTQDDLAQATVVQNLTGSDTVGGDNYQSISGEMYLFNPSSTTYVKHFMARSHFYSSNDFGMDFFLAGYCNVTAAIDGVQFTMSTGNIYSGTIKLYGIKDS